MISYYIFSITIHHPKKRGRGNKEKARLSSGRTLVVVEDIFQLSFFAQSKLSSVDYSPRGKREFLMRGRTKSTRALRFFTFARVSRMLVLFLLGKSWVLNCRENSVKGEFVEKKLRRNFPRFSAGQKVITESLCFAEYSTNNKQNTRHKVERTREPKDIVRPGRDCFL